MFSGSTMATTVPPKSRNNFGDLWGSLLQTVVQVGGQVYTSQQQKDIEESKLTFEREQAARDAQIKQMELEIQKKQQELLAQSTEKPSMISGAPTSVFGDTKNLLMLGGVALGMGLIAYLLLRK